MNVRVEYQRRLDDAEVAGVLTLVEAAGEADGVHPLNEQAMLQLRYGGDEPSRAALLFAGDTLAGYAHVDPSDEGPVGELVVHPGFRGSGHGGTLLRAVLEHTGGRLRVWAHGDHPAAARLAAANGFTRARSLWRMRRPLSLPVPAPVLPEGVRLRAFVPGADEEAWIAVNARAFAHHPEQGAWTIEDLKRREQEPWFDPEGFFLADSGGVTVGFHWTKVHQGDEPVGEVYIVGVDPGQQGTGLGKALTLAGLAHLRERGLAHVILYVDEANTAAVRLYEGLGFTHFDTDVMYSR
ncbi:mycothiol acetyltransferase [Microtetraspora sp. NBRC 13810]|uniref:mycothiol synthase n=1 Tax=Microtetraspora sp. NBRC 13810 TaxID=3030990 RepID=UPI0024A22EE9|nr:mycothiol synthase [Microtetraspora sp. NBRC 13810]GLW10342.1 mycothiol acetyltransferase [Microtetraspora sp. NBRC 13810]